MEQGPKAGQKKRKVQELRQGSHLAAVSMSQVKKKMTKVGDRLLWGVLGEGCWGPRGVGGPRGGGGGAGTPPGGGWGAAATPTGAAGGTPPPGTG